MKSHLFFIGIFLLGPSCKDSLTKYLLVDVDEPRIGNKPVARNPSDCCRTCGGSDLNHPGPCGLALPIEGSNPPIRISFGRPDRCVWMRQPLTARECLEICESWNRAPPQGFASLPCAGFETTGNFGNQTGNCNLIRSRRVNPQDTQHCPGARGYFEFHVTHSVTNASDICRYGPNSGGNPGLTNFTCFAVFNKNLHPNCPVFPICPASTG